MLLFTIVLTFLCILLAQHAMNLYGFQWASSPPHCVSTFLSSSFEIFELIAFWLLETGESYQMIERISPPPRPPSPSTSKPDKEPVQEPQNEPTDDSEPEEVEGWFSWWSGSKKDD